MQLKHKQSRNFLRASITKLATFFCVAAGLAACNDLTGPTTARLHEGDGAESGPSGAGAAFVSPSGSSSNSGSKESPWSLEYALSGADGEIAPGDTVYMRGGTYRGAFRSTLSGASQRPVVLRQYPGERAVIDGSGTPGGTSVFQVKGQWSTFVGFEITNSSSNRTTSSTAHDVRPNVISNSASHTKFINLVVHDGGVAFYNDPAASDVEVAGCIMYNNGWQGPDRGHGHALYLKSVNGPLLARDNVVFNQYGYGIHAYTNQGSGKLNNIRLEGNVAFNNGSLSNVGNAANILLGGDDVATGDLLRDNFTWYSPAESGTNVRVGYGSLRNGSVELSGNYFVGGGTVLDFGYWSSAVVRGNTLVGERTILRLNNSSASGQSMGSNAHRRDPQSSSWSFAGTSYSFASFRSQSGLGGSDQASSGVPSESKVVVRRNPHEAGRAHVIVYNWGRGGSVQLSLQGIVPAGARYEVHNVQNLFGNAVAGGTYSGGTISLPMAGVSPPQVVGASSRAPKTGPVFDVFVVRVVGLS